ncbi:hypothetical protein E2C01_029821 [Portunus trituberculatus]|uniref:Uncharacterized protein n=1 Tax=Portunus trituberculatus TaxID=210409 RepID=A0A5B7ESH3_PORTR|nr:hypothetical protein [Portunus trituberculatus]
MRLYYHPVDPKGQRKQKALPQTHLKGINESFFVIKVEEGGQIHKEVQGGHNGGEGVVAMSLEAEGHSRGKLHHTAALTPTATLRLVHHLAQQLVQQGHHFFMILFTKKSINSNSIHKP